MTSLRCAGEIFAPRLNTSQASATATAQSVPIAAGGNATHALTCAYGGDAHYAASTSTAVSESIPAENLAVTAADSSGTPASQGQLTLVVQ